MKEKEKLGLPRSKEDVVTLNTISKYANTNLAGTSKIIGTYICSGHKKFKKILLERKFCSNIKLLNGDLCRLKNTFAACKSRKIEKRGPLWAKKQLCSLKIKENWEKGDLCGLENTFAA